MYHLIDFCRLCLNFRGEFNNMCNDDIMEKVVACINGLEFDEKLPALICSKCSEQLDKFFDFRNQCLRSEFLLNCYIAKLSCLQNCNKFVNTQLQVNVLKNFKTTNEPLGNVQISKKFPVKPLLNNDNAKKVLRTFNSERLTSTDCSSDFRNCDIISEELKGLSNTNLQNSSETDTIELNSSQFLTTKPKTNTFVTHNDVNAYLSDEDDVFLEEEDDETPQLENINKALNGEIKNAKRKSDNSNKNLPNKKTRLKTNSQTINDESSTTKKANQEKVNVMNNLERDADFLAFSMQGDITEHVKLRKRKVQIRAQAKIEQALKDKLQVQKRNRQLIKNANLDSTTETPPHPNYIIMNKSQYFNNKPVNDTTSLDKLVNTSLEKTPSKLKFLELQNFENITVTHSLNTASMHNMETCNNTLNIDSDSFQNSSATQSTGLNETFYSEQPILKSDLTTRAISTCNTKVSKNLPFVKIKAIQHGKIIVENVKDASLIDSRSHNLSTDLQNCTQNQIGLQAKTDVDFEKSIPTHSICSNLLPVENTSEIKFVAENKPVTSEHLKASENNETYVQHYAIAQIKPLIATTTSSRYSDRSSKKSKKLLPRNPTYKSAYIIANTMSNNARHSKTLMSPILRRLLVKYSSSFKEAKTKFKVNSIVTVSSKTNAIGNDEFEDSINDSLNVTTNLEIPLYDTNTLIKNSLLEISNHDSINLPNVPENTIVASQSKTDINLNPTCHYASLISQNDSFNLTDTTGIFEPIQHTELKPSLICDTQPYNSEECVTFATVSKNYHNPYDDHNYTATSIDFVSSKTPSTSSAKFQSCSSYHKDAKCSGKIKKKSASKRRNKLLPDHDIRMKSSLICNEPKYMVDDPLNILKLFEGDATRRKRSSKKCKKRMISKSSGKDKHTRTGKPKRHIPVRKAEDSSKLEDCEIDVVTVSEPFNPYNISCGSEQKEVTLAKTLEKHRRMEIRKYLNILHAVIFDKNIQPCHTLPLRKTVDAAILSIKNLKMESELLLEQHLSTLRKQNALINKFKVLKEEAETKER